MKIEYSDLLVNENAYFFRQKENIVARDIELIFQECLRAKGGTSKFQPKIREPFIHGSKEIAKVSIDIFEFKKRPSFLKKTAGQHFEVKYGLFLIVEMNGFIGIVRKNVSGAKHLSTRVDKINYEILSRFLITAGSKYEKIVANSMNTASNAIHRKTSEAEDLQQIFSRFGASKQILNSLRIDNKGNKSTVALNTSRVNSFNTQSDFKDLILWMVDMVKLIKLALKNPPQSSFIDGFASPIKFRDKIDSLTPTHLLLRFENLKDDIESGSIKKIKHRESGKKLDISTTILNKEILFELKAVDKVTFAAGEVKVRIRKESLSVNILSFKDIILDFDEYDISLEQYINQNDYFIVVFDQFEYVYTQGMIFRDSKLLGDTDNFLNAFIAHPKLAGVNSEKGSAYRPSSTDFNADSIFHLVEHDLATKSQYLICDDLGVEWGDFIAINEDEITFYHAKYNSGGLSASKLQDVFGQAQKNLGFLEMNDEMIDHRRARWDGNYKLNNVATQIKRIRKSPPRLGTVADIKQYVAHVSGNPNLKRKVYIVLNYISKVRLESALTSLKNGKTFTNKGVTLQILWFVNSLLAVAQERNVELRIYCCP